jgi:hypothetical protein
MMRKTGFRELVSFPIKGLRAFYLRETCANVALIRCQDGRDAGVGAPFRRGGGRAGRLKA